MEPATGCHTRVKYDDKQVATIATLVPSFLYVLSAHCSRYEPC